MLHITFKPEYTSVPIYRGPETSMSGDFDLYLVGLGGANPHLHGWGPAKARAVEDSLG